MPDAESTEPPRLNGRVNKQGGQPLRETVSTVVHKWFQDTLQAAEQGDNEQMLMLSSMLVNGYGCTPDKMKAKAWANKASSENAASKD